MFIHFEHNSCKIQCKQIDIVGGHGSYNKQAKHDNLVYKTKLMFYINCPYYTKRHFQSYILSSKMRAVIKVGAAHI